MTHQNLKINDYYSTTDLALATALSMFFPLETIDRKNSQKAQFLFKSCVSLNKLIETYWKGKLLVNPIAYFNQLKIIKARLYEGRPTW